MKIFYLGWIGNKNIGDEVLLDNFKKLLSKKNKDNYGVYPSYPGVDIYDINNYDVIVLGGGSILLGGYIKILYDAIQKGKKIIIWGSGYDVLEKDLMHNIDTTELPVYVYSDEEEEMLNKIAEEAINFSVRGPLTYKLLGKSFVNMDEIKISGDPAFILEEGKIPEKCPIVDMDISDNIVGVNFGTCLNRIYGMDEEYVKDELVKAIKELINKGCKIYLYSMWPKDNEKIRELYDELIDNKEEVILDLNYYKGEEVMAILKKCIFTINLKLHANIISAVAGTPFIMLGYRFKSYDFVKSINAEDLIIPTDTIELGENILMTSNRILLNYYDYKNNILNEIEKYKVILEESLDKI